MMSKNWRTILISMKNLKEVVPTDAIKKVAR